MKRLYKIALAASCLVMLVAGMVGWYVSQLPDITELRGQVRARQGANGSAAWVGLSNISLKLQAAVLVSEDVDFFQHRGFSLTELRKSLLDDVGALRYRRGGSTITQQVAKNLFLSPEKTLRRKLKEAILAHRLESAFSKDEILEIYLNIAEWGESEAGAEAASRHYFAKAAADLTWSEAALLAGILPNPRQLNPFHSCDAATRVRRTVLVKLLENGDVNSEEFAEAAARPVRCVWTQPT